jgi:hypothetical protein
LQVRANIRQRLERPARDNHSVLFIINVRKKFYNTELRVITILGVGLYP